MHSRHLIYSRSPSIKESHVVTSPRLPVTTRSRRFVSRTLGRVPPSRVHHPDRPPVQWDESIFGECLGPLQSYPVCVALRKGVSGTD